MIKNFLYLLVVLSSLYFPNPMILSAMKRSDEIVLNFQTAIIDGDLKSIKKNIDTWIHYIDDREIDDVTPLQYAFNLKSLDVLVLLFEHILRRDVQVSIDEQSLKEIIKNAAKISCGRQKKSHFKRTEEEKEYFVKLAKILFFLWKRNDSLFEKVLTNLHSFYTINDLIYYLEHSEENILKELRTGLETLRDNPEFMWRYILDKKKTARKTKIKFSNSATEANNYYVGKKPKKNVLRGLERRSITRENDNEKKNTPKKNKRRKGSRESNKKIKKQKRELRRSLSDSCLSVETLSESFQKMAVDTHSDENAWFNLMRYAIKYKNIPDYMRLTKRLLENSETTSEFSQKDPAYINKKDKKNKTLLHHAVEACFLESIPDLIELGADITINFNDGTSVVKFVAQASLEGDDLEKKDRYFIILIYLLDHLSIDKILFRDALYELILLYEVNVLMEKLYENRTNCAQRLLFSLEQCNEDDEFMDDYKKYILKKTRSKSKNQPPEKRGKKRRGKSSSSLRYIASENNKE